MFTVIYNWGWMKHEDCRNAYSVHAENCKVARAAEENEKRNRIQGYTSGIETIDQVWTWVEDDVMNRFYETYQKFGDNHVKKKMVKICACVKKGTK